MNSHRWQLVPALILVALGFAAPVFAQVVDIPNAMVFYFDEAATQRSWYGTGPVTAYLTVGPLEIQGQPCQMLNSWSSWNMEVWPPDHVSGVTLTMRGVATPAVLDLNAMQLDVQVLLAEPLPLSGRTVIAELFMNVVSTEPTQLIAWPYNFTADGTLGWFETLTHGSDGPMDMTGHTASINDDAPVGTQQVAWDQVKALYR